MNGRATSPFRRHLDTVASVSVILAAAAVLLAISISWFGRSGAGRSKQPSIPVPTEAVSLGDARRIGSPDAEVVVIEFADYQCPACTLFAKQIFPGFVEKYVDTGRVVYAFRHLPIEAIHPLAVGAAQAAECAGQQAKFWEMSRELFAISPLLSDDRVSETAKKVGVDTAQFKACTSGALSPEIRNAKAMAEELGVTSVPAFFIGKLRADGRVTVVSTHRGTSRTPEAFYQLVEAQLALAKQRP